MQTLTYLYNTRPYFLYKNLFIKSFIYSEINTFGLPKFSKIINCDCFCLCKHLRIYITLGPYFLYKNLFIRSFIYSEINTFGLPKFGKTSFAFNIFFPIPVQQMFFLKAVTAGNISCCWTLFNSTFTVQDVWHNKIHGLHEAARRSSPKLLHTIQWYNPRCQPEKRPHIRMDET